MESLDFKYQVIPVCVWAGCEGVHVGGGCGEAGEGRVCVCVEVRGVCVCGVCGVCEGCVECVCVYMCVVYGVCRVCLYLSW